MYAVSLLGSVRRIEVHGVQLLEMRTFPSTEAEARLSETLTTLVDIAELLRCNAPFPLDRHTERGEAAVIELLGRRYEEPSAPPEAFEAENVEAVREEAAVETGDSWLLVPLGTDGASARNWQPVFDLLQRQVARLAGDFDRISERMRAGGSEGHLGETCECIVEMLEVLEYTLGRIKATSGYVSYRTEHDQGELLEAIERKTTALGGNTDA
ncbi:hypothetical protein KM295_02315 [Natronomonas sp. F2-12]|jgi:hypothetical protein|uniref:Uncharacterized protein n=1 Tax=Natronomonas aquatica TaxID=2841590 RepID=A0A9R1D3H5_9EURY|nr:hypothetical protein [Natronomonas aquatica]MCQ4332339.1 hypothetical protein [Natronomonas aquatica]